MTAAARTLGKQRRLLNTISFSSISGRNALPFANQEAAKKMQLRIIRKKNALVILICQPLLRVIRNKG
jgi:hypothetical protein